MITHLSVNGPLTIVIRNGRAVWNTGQTGRFFFITWVPKIIRTQSTRACIKYKQTSARNHRKVENKRITSCFVLNLKISGENCLSFNWHSSRAAPGISFFGVPTKDDEYYCCTTWRNNIVAVLTRDTVMKTI